MSLKINSVIVDQKLNKMKKILTERFIRSIKYIYTLREWTETHDLSDEIIENLIRCLGKDFALI